MEKKSWDGILILKERFSVLLVGKCLSNGFLLRRVTNVFDPTFDP